MRLWPFSSPAARITTYEKAGDGVRPVDFRSLPAHDQPAGPAPRAVSGEELHATMDRLQHEPQAQAAAHPVAKDADVNPGTVCMGYDSKDGPSLDFVAQLALVGRVEGFRVQAAAAPDELRRAARKLAHEAAGNVTWTTNPGGHDAWIEDHGEYLEDGTVVVPGTIPTSQDIVEDWILRQRHQRYDEIAKQGGPRPRQDYAMQGLVNDHHCQEEMVSEALSSGLSVTMAGSYVEGGNFLPGHRADHSSYALIGRDSLAITQKLLPPGADLQAAKARIASDYGYQPEEIVAVEQPGEFHLDMEMALAGPGQVLLNDSRQTLELQRKWLQESYSHRWFNKEELADELKTLETWSARNAVYEDIIEKELRQAGLEVFRVAGSFRATSANPVMDFINLRQGVNEQGERFAVSLGGMPEAEQAFAATLLGKIPAGYQRIHFLDRELTAETLKFKGGIKCRSKVRL